MTLEEAIEHRIYFGKKLYEIQCILYPMALYRKRWRDKNKEHIKEYNRKYRKGL